ncbi:MAG: BMP family ABC transporter substrate-binding protein [Symbiobacteriaceae bacterium]|nr:BMP family ABC transporter substrate-binding protein [Symbiobacteriaceae bacterium]
MKKTLALLLTLALCLPLIACNTPAPATPTATTPVTTPPTTAPPPVQETYELALITDIGTIDDKSFNQGSWEGLLQYAEEHGKTFKYYQPPEQSDDAYLSTIELAVKGGAKIIVTPGFLFEVPIYHAQDLYPDVHFILVDGTPHNDSYSDFKINDKVVGLLYAEEEAGFLAGYAAVMDGNRNLGFMGGMAVPAVIRFGYGYVQGAEYAAQELGLGVDSIQINYHYTGGFNASPEIQAMAAAWYNNGFDVIFGCGGAVGNSVMRAAEAVGKKVIGVDVDQSIESPTVITSAMKGLSASVYAAIKGYYEGNFPGGRGQVFAAANDGVGLPMATSKFETFSQADYDAIFAKLVAGTIEILGDGDAEEVTDLPLSAVSVSYFK